MSAEKDNKSNKPLKTIVRIVIAVLIFVVAYLSLPLIDNYYSDHYKKNESLKVTKKSSPFSSSIEVGKIKQFDLTIPKLNVSVPVVPNVEGGNEKVYTEALKNGVAHYKGTALPASGSNILIFGHSSGVWGAGPYSTIFANLNDLNINDEVSINFNNKESKYLVIEKKIIKQSDLSIITPTEREQLTLMTCWPVGTDRDRLVIIAKPVNLLPD